MAKATETKQIEAALEPVVAFNKLVVKNAETAFNMHMASVQAFAEMGLKNITAGLNIANPSDFKSYADNQKDVAQEATSRFVADARAYAELNTKFIEEARVLAEQNMKAASETAKSVVEAAKAA